MATVRELVLSALIGNRGIQLSLNDIVAFIGENETYADKRTIVKCIDELKQLQWSIIEKTERRGRLKLPVKTFSIPAILETQIENKCLE